MSSEYKIDGFYSLKSDVYSFGGWMLEISWMLYTEGWSIEVLDTSIGDSGDPHEVRNSGDRLSMSITVKGISMNSKSVILLKHFQQMNASASNLRQRFMKFQIA
ncbi:unnamed protein product [Prunus armeniaca]|uniref:Uncharacterized protein n=1 Tax=Prunus armeniaca TaxID=36596 RepID=A0A6J5UJW8_PRUAR|nr:unnamed protein product [Prunus armeniaca]